MPRALRILSIGAVAMLAGAGVALPAGAAGYDRSNPTSTGCAKNGASTISATVRTYGVWQVTLKRSTGCGTVWANVARTDGRKCRTGGSNCAKVKIVRTRLGVTTSSGWRRTPVGTTGTFSLQLEARSSSSFVGTAVTVGGKRIGTTGTWSTP